MEVCRLYLLEAKGDERGWLFSLPEESIQFLGEVQEMHLGLIKPLTVRGNHYHPHRREILLVQYHGTWEYFWQLPEEKEPHVETILGSGAIIVEIPPGVAHAIYNPGKEPLVIAAFSNRKHVPGSDDTRKILLF